MEFKKYMHIEKLGNIEVEGIEYGECYIFPKIDGTNGQIFYSEHGIEAGSRKRSLSLSDDNQGFYEYILNQDNLKLLFADYPDLRLYGEWLVKHTLKTYRDDAWKKFYVFDVERDGEFFKYGDYKKILDCYNIEYIPPICKVNNPTHDFLISLLDKNDYLIKDGEGVGEGIVIKNYDFINKYGRKTWAKIVTTDFKAKHRKVNDVLEMKDKQSVEQLIVEKYITESLVNKVYANIVSENNEWSSKNISRMLNTVFYDLIREESWTFLKEHKFPVIDYKLLKFHVFAIVKKIKSELF